MNERRKLVPADPSRSCVLFLIRDQCTNKAPSVLLCARIVSPVSPDLLRLKAVMSLQIFGV